MGCDPGVVEAGAPHSLELEPVHDAFWWLPDREHDAEHVWLRQMLTRVADEVI